MLRGYSCQVGQHNDKRQILKRILVSEPADIMTLEPFGLELGDTQEGEDIGCL